MKPPEEKDRETAAKIVVKWDADGSLTPRGMQDLAERITQALHSTRISALRDDPELDGTDAAHPAYWRGESCGVHGATRRIRAALDGTDDGSGVIGCEELEQLRRDVLALREKLKEAAEFLKPFAEAKVVLEGYKVFDVFAIGRAHTLHDKIMKELNQ